MKQSRLKALIVDDEEHARRLLFKRLSLINKVEVIGQCSDILSAKSDFHSLKPDIVFLDIHLPPYTGFDLVPYLPKDAVIIFITAHVEFALSAFEYGIWDYILKPVSTDRLTIAVDRVYERLRINKVDTYDENLNSIKIDHVWVHANGKLIKVNYDTISIIQAAGNYTELHFKGNSKVFVHKSMTFWREILPSDIFLDVDRSKIINKFCITKIVRHSRDLSNVSIEGCETAFKFRRFATEKLKDYLKS